MDDKIKSEIERRYPHLKVLKTGYSRYGTPMAIVQVVDVTSPVYGIYAVMYRVGRDWVSGVRSINLSIVENAFTRYMKSGIY